MTIPSVTTTTLAPAAAPRTGVPVGQASGANASEIQTAAVEALAQAPLEALLAMVKQGAAARQDGLAALMANALQASATTQLPDPVQTAVNLLLALHLPTDRAPDAGAVKAALQTSGLFTEANLSSGAAQLPVDVKTALLQLNQAAEGWMARAAIAPDPQLEKAAKPSPVQPGPPEPLQRASTKNDAASRNSQSQPEKAAPAARSTSQTPLTELAASPVRAPIAAPAALPGKLPMPPAAAPARPTAAPKAEFAIETPLPSETAAIVSSARPLPGPAIKTDAAASPSLSRPATSFAQVVPAAEPMPASAGSFKPVLQLLTQAIEVLDPAGTTKAPPALSAPATPAQSNYADTTGRPLIPGQLRSAVTLINEAIEVWPSTPPTEDPRVKPSSPEPAIAAAMTKLAAQTLATAPNAAPAKAPETALPPEIKTVLAVLEKAVGPWLEQLPASVTTPATAPGSTPVTAATPPSTTAPAANGTSDAKSATADNVQRKAPATPMTATAPAAPDGKIPTVAAPFVTPLFAEVTPNTALNDVRALLGLLNRVVQSSQESPTPAQVNTQENRPPQPGVPPPPIAGAPSRAQSAATPTLPENADVALVAKTLAVGSDAALARQTLLQIASLPDSSAQTRSSQARWIFDLPVMTAQGPAVAQIAIERDGRNATPEKPQPVWRVQFAIDITPLGPVRASMALSGAQAWVTIHAENSDAIEKLRGQVSWLAGALQENELEPNIAVEPGRAMNAGNARRRLVDRAS